MLITDQSYHVASVWQPMESEIELSQMGGEGTFCQIFCPSQKCCPLLQLFWHPLAQTWNSSQGGRKKREHIQFAQHTNSALLRWLVRVKCWEHPFTLQWFHHNAHLKKQMNAHPYSHSVLRMYTHLNLECGKILSPNWCKTLQEIVYGGRHVGKCCVPQMATFAAKKFKTHIWLAQH